MLRCAITTNQKPKSIYCTNVHGTQRVDCILQTEYHPEVSTVNNRERASEINIQEIRQKSTQDILYKQCQKQEPSASTNKIKINQNIGVENTEIRSLQAINIVIVIIVIVVVIVVTVRNKVLRNIGTKIIIITDGRFMYSWKIEGRENVQNTFSMQR